MKPPVQWNCAICPTSGLLAPPMEAVMIEDGIIEVPETTEKGELIFEMVDAKDEKGKPLKSENGKPMKVRQPKMKKQARMVNPKKKGKRQNSITGKMEEIEIPSMKDLAERIHMVQIRVGEESVTRFLCSPCLDKNIKALKKVRDLLEGMQ